MTTPLRPVSLPDDRILIAAALLMVALVAAVGWGLWKVIR